MHTKIAHAARAELANALRGRYRSATGKEKHKILDELIATTGYYEKSAIRVLNGGATAKRPQTRNRSTLYDDAVRAALIVLWEASDRVSSKRLKALEVHLGLSLPAPGWPLMRLRRTVQSAWRWLGTLRDRTCFAGDRAHEGPPRGSMR